jgi:DNA-binding response OmpR family regulator
MDILVIEDDKLTLNTLQYSLSNMGHNAFVAENGKEAIEHISGRRFDLLLSDIMMPGISGLSLVRVIRSVHDCDTPIIMMSTLHNKPLLDAAFEEGANDFIAKPFTMEDLADKLRKFD